MKNQQQEIYILIEKLFDAKLEPIKLGQASLKADFIDIKKALYGNGHEGIAERIRILEYWRYYITGGFVTISVVVGFFINEIKGLIFRR